MDAYKTLVEIAKGEQRIRDEWNKETKEKKEEEKKKKRKKKEGPSWTGTDFKELGGR